MRWLIGVALLTSAPALAAGPQCAPQQPIVMADAAPTSPQPDPAAQADGPTSAAEHLQPAAGTAAPLPVPPGLVGLPFAQHVASAGATLFDLGLSHGLHLAAARSGDVFKMFAVLPGGAAAIEGAPVELTLGQLNMIASGNVTSLGEDRGFTGYFVRSGPQFQVFYASPDNQVMVPGILRDAQGKDITRDQVAKIPGAIPTVEVSGQDAAPASPQTAAAAEPVATAATLAAVEKAEFATLGPATAPQLFMMIDPQCIYSVRAYQQLRGFAQAGRIRLSVIPLSVLDYEDHGQSTKSALALLSKPADQILTAWQVGDVAGPITSEAPARLRQNMAIAEAVGMKGTPTFIWRKTDGTIGRIDGVPPDITSLVASIGS